MTTQKIIPFLWFDTEAGDAARFYTSVFRESGMLNTEVYENTPSDTLMNAGPHFKFNEAISFVVDCADQAEVDYYWDALTADGGEESMCGWLTDRFGVSWQVVPRWLNALLSDPDRAKANRVQQAMLKMKRIVIAELEAAYPDD